MKKLLYFASAMALMVACGPAEDNKEPIDWGEITEDGFYLTGEATGATEVSAEWAMAAGVNEVDKTNRDGMFEKYAWLEAGKDFELVYHAAGENTRYSSALEDTIDGNDGNHADHPTILFKRGELIIGNDAPAMQVAETGMYHIVLDLNNAGDLAKAQIVLAPAEWGVRGGMNSWGFTPGEMNRADDGTITYTWTDQNLATGGEFKFAYGHGWKIQLDDAGLVKANTNLGADCVAGGDNIAVEKAGLYTITLTFKNAGGTHAKSFSYNVVCTEESDLPETMNLIGVEFGNWDWNNCVEMIPVHSAPGKFWTVRYVADPANGFKFCAEKAWNGDFTGLGNDTGYTVADNNCFVAEAGLYTMIVDLTAGAVTIAPAQIYGIGDAFGGWTEGANAFTVNADGTASITTTAAGNLRMYVETDGPGNWWHSEFNIYDGAIVYRAGGNDQAAVAVGAGQTVTLNFNAGTGSIQ